MKKVEETIPVEASIPVVLTNDAIVCKGNVDEVTYTTQPQPADSQEQKPKLVPKRVLTENEY